METEDWVVPFFRNWVKSCIVWLPTTGSYFLTTGTAIGVLGLADSLSGGV